MIIPSNPNSAVAYENLIRKGKDATLQEAILYVLQLCCTDQKATAADIINMLNIDARNNTRLRELWKEGLVRKTGVRKESVSTGEIGDEWEFVPEGPKRIYAQYEYYVAYKKRLQRTLDEVLPEIQRTEKILAELWGKL